MKIEKLDNRNIPNEAYDNYYNEIIYSSNIHGIRKNIEFWIIRRNKRK